MGWVMFMFCIFKRNYLPLKTFLNSLPGLQGFLTTVTEMILQKAAVALCSLDETRIFTVSQVGETPNCSLHV